MKLFSIIFLLLVFDLFSFGQAYLNNTFPKDSLKVDSVSISYIKLENSLIENIKKHQPERKIIELWFNHDLNKGDSIYLLVLSNKNDATYSNIIRSKSVFGYFIIDSVLFIINNKDIPIGLFQITDKNKTLYTEDNNCMAMSFGTIGGIESVYKIKVKRKKLKIRKKSDFFAQIGSVITYYWIRIFSRRPKKIDN